MSMNEEARRQAQRYLSMSEDQLFSSIPQYLPEYDGVYFSPDGKIAAGRDFFERHLPLFRECVCVKWEYCRRRNDPDLLDTVTLVTSVADIIATAAGATVPTFVIAALLIKKSLNVLCQCP